MLIFFFFNDTATTEIYTLSLHDALPICGRGGRPRGHKVGEQCDPRLGRSEEHTSELQSHNDLVCRLLLEKKKRIVRVNTIHKPDAADVLVPVSDSLAAVVTRRRDSLSAL